MTYAYLRVSTLEQNNEKFESEILRYANKNNFGTVHFINEKISGTKDWKKRQLGSLINDTCINSDIILVPELSRLARSISQIYEIISVCQNKGIVLHILKQNLIIENKTDINTKIMLSTFALAAELEREFISIRTKEALHVKKEQGITLGRPKGSIGKSKLDLYADEIKALKAVGSTNTFIAHKYNCSIASVGHWLNNH